MAGLVAAKCPNCGANVRIDPEREYATCAYCQMSSFVKTPSRSVSEQARINHSPVIDLGSSRGVAAVIWIAAGSVVTALAGVGLIAFAMTRAAPPPPPSVTTPASSVATSPASAATPEPASTGARSAAAADAGASPAPAGEAEQAALTGSATGPAIGGPRGTRPCTFHESVDTYKRQCVARVNADGSVLVTAKGTALNPDSGFEFTLHGGANNVWTAKGTLNAFGQCKGPFVARTVLSVDNGVKVYELRFKQHCGIVVR